MNPQRRPRPPRHSQLPRQDEFNEKIHFFPSSASLPFPTEVDVDSDFPALPYSTRRGAVKSVIHWGQRKLLLSEIQLLIEAIEAKVRSQKEKSEANQQQPQKFTIVYPGSAPGTHLPFLDKLFPGNEWILIDPIRFHPTLSSLTNFRLINGYFTAVTALSLVGERLIRNSRPALARVATFAATRGEDCTVHPLNERVKQAEDGANLIKGVQEVDTGVADEGDEDGQQKESSKAQAISSFLRDRFSPLNLLIGVAMSTIPPPPPPPAAAASACPQRRDDLRCCSSSTSPMGEMLFVSDIRSGTSTLTDDVADPDKLGADFESHVMNDMRVQMEWVEMLRPSLAMLKFRLPYMEVYDPISKKVVHRHPHAQTEYLQGKVLLPIWTRPTSTECRLLVPEGARRMKYDNRKFENQLFFFNTVLRERVHFNHVVEGNRSSYLDHRYDGTAEVNLLLRYLKIRRCTSNDQEGQEGDESDTSSAVLKLSHEITQNLGKPFEHAANRLNDLALERAKERGFFDVQQQIVQKCDEKRAMDIWWKNIERTSEDNSESPSKWSWYYRSSIQ